MVKKNTIVNIFSKPLLLWCKKIAEIMSVKIDEIISVKDGVALVYKLLIKKVGERVSWNGGLERKIAGLVKRVNIRGNDQEFSLLLYKFLYGIALLGLFHFTYNLSLVIDIICISQKDYLFSLPMTLTLTKNIHDIFLSYIRIRQDFYDNVTKKILNDFSNLSKILLIYHKILFYINYKIEDIIIYINNKLSFISFMLILSFIAGRLQHGGILILFILFLFRINSSGVLMWRFYQKNPHYLDNPRLGPYSSKRTMFTRVVKAIAENPDAMKGVAAGIGGLVIWKALDVHDTAKNAEIAEKDRQHDATESAKAREYESNESAKAREYESNESAKGREQTDKHHQELLAQNEKHHQELLTQNEKHHQENLKKES